MVIRAGVIGHPITHSLSPAMHRRWLDRLGIDGIYEAIDCSPERLFATVRRLADAGWAGLNVTTPHKEAVLGLLTAADGDVQDVNASNLLTFGGGAISGANSDIEGFARTLDSLLPDRWDRTKNEPIRTVVLGAGGVVRPIAHLLSPGVVLTNRTQARADALARDGYGDVVVPWARRHEALEGADLLVNATTLGTSGHPPLELDLGALPRDAAVIDVVYNPLETPLLRAARQRGHRCANGLAMLVHQAIPSFEAFYGVRPDDPEETIGFLADLLRRS